ncbi:MAG: HEAT repeat domain-containing protein [Opitutus sp.]|nr:HEAT repeat domain-containing protein [Opitutus sp.]
MRYPFTVDGFEGQELAAELPGLFGAPRLLVDGQPAPPGENPLEFVLTRPGGGSLTVRLKPSNLGSMLSVEIGDVLVPLMEPLAWYEWAWNGLPFLLVVGGGAVGGLLGGAAAFVNLRFFRTAANPFSRYALTAAISVATLMSYLAVVAGIDLAFGKTTAEKALVAARPTTAPAPGSPSKPGAARARSFVLPQDWNALRTACQAEITGADRWDRLTLQLGAVSENVSITVPAGLILRPVSPDARTGACLTRRPEALSSAATGGTKTFSLPVFNADAARWSRPGKTDTYEAVAVETDARVVKFIDLAQEPRLDFNLAQTGIWVLREDISVAQFSKNRLFTNTYNIDSGRFQTTSLANYGGIRKLRLAIQGLGLDPAGFQLFREYRAELEKILQRMDFEKPLVNWNTILFNGSLETYAGEPEIEAVLLRYATRHADLSIRESALKSLMKIGLAGDPAVLLQQMLTTESREHRFVAAHALVAAGDLRGQPVLAALAEDPSLGKLISETKARSVLPVLKKMLGGSKEEKSSAISLLDRWKNDPETLTMLETMRNDPDVGRNATNVLKRHGR